MKTIITLHRPNTDVPFFSAAIMEDKSTASNFQIFWYDKSEQYCDTTNKWSEDELTLERTFTWKTETSKAELDAIMAERFPSVVEERSSYCAKHGHVMTKVDEE